MIVNKLKEIRERKKKESASPEEWSQAHYLFMTEYMTAKKRRRKEVQLVDMLCDLASLWSINL